MRYLFPLLLLLLLATPALATDTVTIDRDGVTTSAALGSAAYTASTAYSPVAGSSSLTTTGTVTSGTWSGSFGAVSGANLTGLTAANLSGTIPSGVLGNSSLYIGSTAIALNRATASQSLTGITSIDGYAAGLSGGNSTTLLGSIPYQSNTNVTTLLGPNTTSTKKFLRQTGTGTNGAAPAWDTVVRADVTDFGTGVGTALGTSLGTAGGVSTTIAAGTAALGTSAISSGACATAVTATATNVATTDVINWGFNGDPTGVTGYAPTANGMLTIIAYPATNQVGFRVCNLTAASVTPGAITLNFRVNR